MPAEDIQSWSPTAATNATADTGINWAEGQPRASVNNSARSMMAATAKDRNLKNGSITTGGTANAQTFISGVSYTTVPSGLTVRLKVGVTNTGATTLNMDGIGAVAIKDQAGLDIGANALLLGRYVDLLYNGTNWVLLSSSGASAAPFDALAYNGMQINGSMDVSQENGTAAVVVANTSKYVVDGFGVAFVGAGASATCGQIAISTLPGYQNALAMQCTAANALAASLDGSYFYQNIEGYRWARLAYGTASAQPVTIGFWVNPNIAGTMAVSVRGATSRSYVVDVPVTAATWQFKTVTIPGDVTGTWNTGNGIGATISFCFGAGLGRKIAANTWTATTDAVATSATTNFFAATGTSYITGVVVLAGSDAPSAARAPLIMRPYDQELLTCMRYLHRRTFVAAEVIGVLQCFSATLASGKLYDLPVRMRSAPTATASTPASNFAVYSAGASIVTMASTNWAPVIDGLWLNTSTVGAASMAAGDAACFIANLPSFIQLDARL